MTSPRTVIHAEHLLDVVAGDWIHDARVLANDGRVEAILGAGDAVPADATELTLPGPWVVPGLIDCHSHQVGDIEYAGVPATMTSRSEEALIGVRNARTTLAAGFTTVRDVGSYRAFVDVELQRSIDAGWTPGPRMQSCGAMITCPGGGGDVTGLARDIVLPDDLRFGVVRTPDEMREKVRVLIGGGAGVIKLIVTGAVLTRGTKPGFVELGTPMVEAAVDEAWRQGVYVAAHAHGTEGIKVAIRAGVRSIEHGSLIDDEGIDLLVKHGTYLVADVYDGDWIAEEGAAGWMAGRDDGQERADHPGPARRVQQGREGRGAGSPSGPTAGSTRTGGTRSSSGTRSVWVRRRWRPFARRRSSRRHAWAGTRWSAPSSRGDSPTSWRSAPTRCSTSRRFERRWRSSRAARRSADEGTLGGDGRTESDQAAADEAAHPGHDTAPTSTERAGALRVIVEPRHPLLRQVQVNVELRGLIGGFASLPSSSPLPTR